MGGTRHSLDICSFSGKGGQQRSLKNCNPDPQKSQLSGLPSRPFDFPSGDLPRHPNTPKSAAGTPLPTTPPERQTQARRGAAPDRGGRRQDSAAGSGGFAARHPRASAAGREGASRLHFGRSPRPEGREGGLGLSPWSPRSSSADARGGVPGNSFARDIRPSQAPDPSNAAGRPRAPARLAVYERRSSSSAGP
ncbi:uncharacterized protein LOC141580146 [Saimiri boliviensis]|uniref:uncharacterized protein LOC141580146 n=1 Tax=Saimiri boliviensis TaxID=27679 RepID=UPI003D77BFDD